MLLGSHSPDLFGKRHVQGSHRRGAGAGRGSLICLPLKSARVVIALSIPQQQSRVPLFVFAGNVRGMMDLAGKVNNLPG